MKKELRFILSFVLAALIAVTALTGCNDNTQDPNEGQNNGEILNIGEDETTFRFEVTDDKGEATSWDITTDEKIVGVALLKEGLISGEETEYGLMVTTINGVTADYDANGAYWAFYVDGDYAMSGVDTTNIEQGKTYAFIYTTD